MATKYVRKTGSDSGTSGPFLTIGYALNNVESGDIIIVGDGEYREHVSISRNNITLRSENRHGAIIAGKENTLYTVRVTADDVSIKDFVITYLWDNFDSSSCKYSSTKKVRMK